MDNQNVLNSKAVKGFDKNLLWVIALVTVLIEGFISLVITIGKVAGTNGVILTWFLIIFPVLGLVGFFCLTILHNINLYLASHFKNKETFLNMLKMSVKVEDYLSMERDIKSINENVNVLSERVEHVEDLSKQHTLIKCNGD